MLASGLIFISVSFASIVTLALHVWDVHDESLCITSENTASGGLADRAKVTVLLSLAISFSMEAVLQMLQRHMYSAGGFMAGAG